MGGGEGAPLGKPASSVPLGKRSPVSAPRQLLLQEQHPRDPRLRPPSPAARAAPGAYLPHVESPMTHPAGSELPRGAGLPRGHAGASRGRQTKATRGAPQAARGSLAAASSGIGGSTHSAPGNVKFPQLPPQPVAGRERGSRTAWL